ncbi:MAG: hypothetical protein FWD61_02885 [Phycisphaerales bacterium]|nr:hypothetical protein [Phycisphaerales bacterium]
MSETATKTSWTNNPIKQPKKIKVNLSFSEEQYRALCKGFVPQEMEDKWFIYHEDDWLYFHHSWVHCGIYRARLTKKQNGVVIEEFEVERHPKIYRNEDEEDIVIFATLIAHLLLKIDVRELGIVPTLCSDDNALKLWSIYGNAMFGPLSREELDRCFQETSKKRDAKNGTKTRKKK